MYLNEAVHHRVHLRAECLEEFGIRMLDYCHYIIAFACGRIVLQSGNLVEDIEKFIIFPCHPQCLGLSQNGRNIIRSKVQGLIVVCKGGGIIVHGHLPFGKSR